MNDYDVELNTSIDVAGSRNILLVDEGPKKLLKHVRIKRRGSCFTFRGYLNLKFPAICLRNNQQILVECLLKYKI